jgi:hypothetical protein
MSTVHASLAPILVMIGRGGRRFQSLDTEAVDLFDARLGGAVTWLEMALHG